MTTQTAPRWLLAGLALVIGVGNLGACDRGERTQAERGARVYFRSCASCHGPRGEGAARAGFKIPPPKLADPTLNERLSDDDLRRLITEGRGQMPPFGKLMSEEDITLVIEHVRALSRTTGKPAP